LPNNLQQEENLVKTTKLIFVALVAMLAFAFAASAASASVAIGTPGLLTTASGVLTLSANGNVITCNVSLGIQLQSRITKTSGALVGSVLASPTSTITNCNLGVTQGTVLSGITLTYVSFAGTLPNITQVNAQSTNAAFSLNIPAAFGVCLFRGSVNVTLPVSGGSVSSATLSGTNSLTTSGPAIGCGGVSPASLNGTLALSLRVALTLLNA
jgi:hypothetical protein